MRIMRSYTYEKLLWNTSRVLKVGALTFVVVVLPLTQSFSLPSSAGVRGPASRGRVPTVGAPAGEGEEHRDGGRKGWRTESVLSGQVVPTGPAERAPLGARGRRRGGVRCGGPRCHMRYRRDQR